MWAVFEFRFKLTNYKRRKVGVNWRNLSKTGFLDAMKKRLFFHYGEGSCVMNLEPLCCCSEDHTVSNKTLGALSFFMSCLQPPALVGCSTHCWCLAYILAPSSVCSAANGLHLQHSENFHWVLEPCL